MLPERVVRGKPNPLHWKFPERLLRARRAQRMTADALSLAAGVSNSAVSHFEAKTRLPRLMTMERIANALHVSPGWLAFGIEALWVPFEGLRCDGLAGRLQAVRTAKGLTLRELDRRAEISTGASRAIQAGGMPTLDTIEHLARALRVSPAWLAYGEGGVELPSQRRANQEESPKLGNDR